MRRTCLNTAHLAAPWLLAAAMLGSATASAQTEITRGEVIAATCYTCHGTHGASPSTIPSIDYFQPERMTEILRSYRAGTRVATVMGRHASGYTDAEIVEVAMYLGKLQKRGK